MTIPPDKARVDPPVVAGTINLQATGKDSNKVDLPPNANAALKNVGGQTKNLDELRATRDQLLGTRNLKLSQKEDSLTYGVGLRFFGIGVVVSLLVDLIFHSIGALCSACWESAKGNKDAFKGPIIMPTLRTIYSTDQEFKKADAAYSKAQNTYQEAKLENQRVEFNTLLTRLYEVVRQNKTSHEDIQKNIPQYTLPMVDLMNRGLINKDNISNFTAPFLIVSALSALQKSENKNGYITNEEITQQLNKHYSLNNKEIGLKNHEKELRSYLQVTENNADPTKVKYRLNLPPAIPPSIPAGNHRHL